MKFYIVGGYLRDLIMGIPSHDIDIAVEGSSYEEMMATDRFVSVGKSFPVFLHKETNMEFALCRTETKTGITHQDFSFNTKNVSIIEDLRRRDFTCNALAMPVEIDLETGKIISDIDISLILDPFGGIKDILNKELKIVDPKHFIEDPLRLIRFCRFLTTLNFTASEETYNILSSMNDNFGDGKSYFNEFLSFDRINLEIEKASVSGLNTSIFWKAMLKIGLLKRIFPELYKLSETLECPKYHTESTVFGHTMKALDMVKDESPMIKWAVICHDLYKSVSYAKKREIIINYAIEHNKPYNTDNYYILLEEDDKEFRKYCKDNKVQYHFDHDTKEACDFIESACRNLRIKSSWIKFTLGVVKTHMKVWNIFDGMKISTFYDLIVPYIRKNLLNDMIKVYIADHFGDRAIQDKSDPVKFKEICSLIEKIVNLNSFSTIIEKFDKSEVSIEKIKYKMREDSINAIKKEIKLLNF